MHDQLGAPSVKTPQLFSIWMESTQKLKKLLKSLAWKQNINSCNWILQNWGQFLLT